MDLSTAPFPLHRIQRVSEETRISAEVSYKRNYMLRLAQLLGSNPGVQPAQPVGSNPGVVSQLHKPQLRGGGSSSKGQPKGGAGAGNDVGGGGEGAKYAKPLAMPEATPQQPQQQMLQLQGLKLPPLPPLPPFPPATYLKPVKFNILQGDDEMTAMTLIMTATTRISRTTISTTSFVTMSYPLAGARKVAAVTRSRHRPREMEAVCFRRSPRLGHGAAALLATRWVACRHSNWAWRGPT